MTTQGKKLLFIYLFSRLCIILKHDTRLYSHLPHRLHTIIQISCQRGFISYVFTSREMLLGQSSFDICCTHWHIPLPIDRQGTSTNDPLKLIPTTFSWYWSFAFQYMYTFDLFASILYYHRYFCVTQTHKPLFLYLLPTEKCLDCHALVVVVALFLRWKALLSVCAFSLMSSNEFSTWRLCFWSANAFSNLYVRCLWYTSIATYIFHGHSTFLFYNNIYSSNICFNDRYFRSTDTGIIFD